MVVSLCAGCWREYAWTRRVGDQQLLEGSCDCGSAWKDGELLHDMDDVHMALRRAEHARDGYRNAWQKADRERYDATCALKEAEDATQVVKAIDTLVGAVVTAVFKRIQPLPFPPFMSLRR